MTLATIEQFLGPDGPIARRLEDYEVRPEQLQMAAAVEAALDSSSQLIVEAGTGVGKSFAYLVPAIKCILQNSARVVVATNTIALQEQLIEKDLPLLHATIPDEFTSVLVKGRGNYLSMRRLKLASERQDRLFSDDAARHSLHTIEDWAYTTTDGTLATLPQLERPEVWDYAQSDAHNCMGKKCPTYDKCFFQAARRRMENGDLLVCNHAIFFADLALRSRGISMLPPYDHVILDEAHGIEDTASDHFGLSMSESRVQHLLRILYRPDKGTGFLAGFRANDSSRRSIDAVINLVVQAHEASSTFFNSLRDWQERFGRSEGTVSEADIVPNVLSPAAKELSDGLRLLKKNAAAEADEFELNSYAERAAAIAEETSVLISQLIEESVYWLELSKPRASSRFRAMPPRVTLKCSPIDVGPILRERLFGQEKGIVLTSATLATTRDDFSHVQKRLGCESANTLQLGSPFDHAAQVRLIVDRTMPAPNESNFEDELQPRILHHINETDGGAFVLFTSFGLMNNMATRLREQLALDEHPVLVQGQDGPRNVILNRFRENDRSVLFGTSSFWQGVDVRGRALRNVIITRLPFDVPDRPLIRARHDRIKEQGGNPFMEDQLPRAVIRFKQGFGRLIRSASDTGRVVVLDPRIVTKYYGRAFINALPEGIEVEMKEPDPWDDCVPD